MLQVGRQLVLWAAVPEDRSLAQLLLFMLLLARAQRCFTLPYRSLPPDTQRKIVTEEVAPAPARIRKQGKTKTCCRLHNFASTGHAHAVLRPCRCPRAPASEPKPIPCVYARPARMAHTAVAHSRHQGMVDCLMAPVARFLPNTKPRATLIPGGPRQARYEMESLQKTCFPASTYCRT